MSRVRAFGHFWWDFIVGDDWIVAACVAAAIGLTAALAHSSVTVWWLLPVAVAAVLWLSLRRVAR